MKKTVKTTGRGQPLRIACAKCDKPITHGYGFGLFDRLTCKECVKASPEMLAKLHPKDRKELTQK